MRILKFGIKKNEQRCNCGYCGCEFCFHPKDAQIHIQKGKQFSHKYIDCPYCGNKIFIGVDFPNEFKK